METPRPPLAVTGLSALFPGSRDKAGFWRDILAGRDLIGDVPETHWLVGDYYDPDPQAEDKTYARRGAFLSPMDFDPLEFGVPPNVVPATDSSQLLALIAAKQVLDDAVANQFGKVDRERTSVILGATSAQELLVEMGARLQRPVWVKALREHGLPEAEVQRVCDRIAASYTPWQENTFPGLLGNVIAGRIANRLNLGGTNCITDAACASSFSALQMGANELYLGQSDLVIVGGVETFNDIFMFMCFSKTPALSPTGDCRPFAKSADGTLLGEGIAMLALRRLEDAERDGDRIYAVVRGIGSSSDGRNKSVYAPVPEGQAKALRRAYAAAGYSPATVGLVEAHGTGTKAGDVAEFEGLRQVFHETGNERRQWCALGSVKSQVGHTKAAAGAAGLFKAVMALHHKVLPPTLKVDEPHPGLEIESTPFYLNTEARPWVSGSAHPRRASVSSFGFGGSNFHVAVEEYAGPGARPDRVAAWPAELLLFAEPDEAALVARCRTLTEALSTGASLELLARRSHEGLDPRRPARLAIVAADAADLQHKLQAALESLEKAKGAPFALPGGVHYALADSPGKLAFLFPGQGSQYLGMGQGLAMAFDAAREVWDRAADLGLDPALHEIVYPRPAFSQAERERNERRLVSTEWAQPAIGAHSAALLAVARRLGIVPDAVAGHSFGEVTALFAAAAFDLGAFLRVARRRGELMAEAAGTPGAMLAVAASHDDVRAAIEPLGGRVVIANHNGPRQVVLSGAVDAIEQAATALAARGLSARRLPVSTAFHSPIVAGCSGPLGEFLRTVEIGPLQARVYSNAEAAAYPDAPDAVRTRLAEQLARPVRFLEMVEALYADGVRTFVELGPGGVLGGLVGECLGGRPHVAVSLDRKGQHAVASLWGGLARLWARGVAFDVAPLLAAFARPADPGTARKPGLSLKVSGANYGKPYPPPGGTAALPKPNPPRPGVAPAAPEAPEHAVAARLPKADDEPRAAVQASSGWVAAYAEVQRQTAEAHEAYLRATAEAHTAYLKTAEASFAGLIQLAIAGPDQPMRTAAIARYLEPAASERQAEPAPPAMPGVPAVPVDVAVPSPVRTSVPEKAQTFVSAVVERSLPPADDLEATLVAVVADKTGYPAEALSLEMDLESDLGIDSIKRVEILAALQERLPGLPEIKPAQIAALHTLGHVVALVREGRGEPAAATSAVPAAAPVALRRDSLALPRNGKGHGNGDMQATVLSVVAEKTGYPSETLSLEMELESDLGIDSIKRVEILAALQERVPGLPEIKPAQMAALRTLGQIVARLHGSHELPPEAPAVEAPALRQQPAAASEAPAVRAQAAEEPPALTRLVLREQAAPALGAALLGIRTSGPLIVTDDGGGIAAALVRRLRDAGVDALVASEPPPGGRAVVSLDALATPASIDDALAVTRRIFERARVFAPRIVGDGGVFVTVQDTGGDFGLGGDGGHAGWLGGLPGLVKTAACEWPDAGLRAIDVERGGRSAEAVADALAEELLRGGAELEVGLRSDGRRTTPVLEPLPAAAGAPGVGSDSVIVASGGGRGVTAACLIALARERRPKIALLGRTPLRDEPAALHGIEDEAGLMRALSALARGGGRNLAPAELRVEVRAVRANRELRATLAALAAAGSPARYFEADVHSEADVRKALEQVRQLFGPIGGLVHGAGAIADKRIEQKTDAHWRSVFETKALGLRNLLAATARDPLRMLCVFSSVAGRFGNEGQADYAMANEVVSKVAAAEARRRGPACVVKALHWGPWDGGMVDAGLRAHFAARGVPLIGLEAGARAFVRELEAPGDVEVVLTAGAAADLAPRERESALEFHVAAGSHAFLDAHRVLGTPVLPVVVALDWVARAARAHRPDLLLAEIRDLRVRRGIRLLRFEQGGETFRVRCRELAPDAAGVRLALEIRGEDGALHYSAEACLAETRDGAREPRATRSAPPASSSQVLDLYATQLFHGPAFQVIRSLALEARAAFALLAGVREQGWSGGPWQLDAAALDGGLQLAILLGQRLLGRPSLPTAIGRVRIFASGPATGEVRCRLDVGESAPLRLRADLRFEDAQGAPLAEMDGVEMHALAEAPPDAPEPCTVSSEATAPEPLAVTPGTPRVRGVAQPE